MSGLKENLNGLVKDNGVAVAVVVCTLLLVIFMLLVTRKEGMEVVPGGYRSGAASDPYGTGLKYHGTRDDTGYGWGGSLTPYEQWEAQGGVGGVGVGVLEHDVVVAAPDGFIGREMPSSSHWPPLSVMTDYKSADGQSMNVLAHKGSKMLAEHSMESGLTNHLLGQ